MNRFRSFAYQVSKNHTKNCWVLKCDIRKFFDSIDHKILIGILNSYIPDKKVIGLLTNIIGSFALSSGKALPLGNLTSQLFANVYMNALDQFVKHTLKAKYYIRYADDFVFLSHSRDRLEALLPRVEATLLEVLRLKMHPNKIFIKTFSSGVDFLGWVHFTDHRVLRTTTKRRMMRRLREHPTEETRQSYLGLLGQGNTVQIKKKLARR